MISDLGFMSYVSLINHKSEIINQRSFLAITI